MYAKSVILLLALGSIDANFYDDHSYLYRSPPIDRLANNCNRPRLANGRVRLRQRFRLAKFTCFTRYELVGNMYATCRNGEWDVPPPVCVRPSCRIPQLQNGLTMLSHNGAWVIFFCFPNHELVGSPAIYCDGVRWNATAPNCVGASNSPKLSCDFEDPDLCGWQQDLLHDFDWKRLNSKTPSSFFFTGPSFDHTLGEGKSGHYMYIESTPQVENDTARLISPIYDKSLSQDGCFSFAYHMYGKTIGGLRVYQKPDNVSLIALLKMSNENKRPYILFEKWGNLGDTWFNAISTLSDFSVDFQIVIEGIRGSSYASDIAIDDVAILLGENCTEAAKSAITPTTPASYSDSCVDRCVNDFVNEPSHTKGSCGCSYNCYLNENCCLDFYEVCIFTSDSTISDTNVSVTPRAVSEELPQTLKLVSVTTESTTKVTPNITVMSSTQFITPRWTTPTIRKPLTSPKPKYTTSKSTSTSTTTTTTTTPSTIIPSTTKPSMTTSSTTTLSTTTPTSTTPLTTPSTKQTTTRKLITGKYKPTTSKSSKRTTKFVPISIKVKPLQTIVPITKKTPITTSYKVSKPIDNDNYLESVEKAKKEEQIETGEIHNKKKVVHGEVKVFSKTAEKSTSVTVIVIIIVLASLTAVGMLVHAGLRSTRLRIALARFRGRRNRDPEVRYLSSDVNDN